MKTLIKTFLSLFLCLSLFSQANWNSPTNTSTYSDVLTQLKARDLSCIKQDPSADSNIPVGAYRDVIGTCTSSVNCFKGDKEYYHASGWLKTLDPRNIFEATTVGGTANAITASTTPAFTTINANTKIWFQATNTNTSATTLALNAQTAMSIKFTTKGATSVQALKGYEIRQGNIYILQYIGTDWILLNPSRTESDDFYNLGLASGSGTTLSWTSPPTLTGNNLRIRFISNLTNGVMAVNSANINVTIPSVAGGATVPLNVNGSQVTGGELENGGTYEAVYASGAWNLLNPFVNKTNSNKYNTWTPSITVGGGGTYTSVSCTVRYKQMANEQMFFTAKCLGTITGTVSQIEMNLPPYNGVGGTVNGTTYPVEQAASCFIFQNGGAGGCYANVEPSTDKVYIFKSDNSAFTPGVNGGFVVTGIYKFTNS